MTKSQRGSFLNVLNNVPGFYMHGNIDNCQKGQGFCGNIIIFSGTYFNDIFGNVVSVHNGELHYG